MQDLSTEDLNTSIRTTGRRVWQDGTVIGVTARHGNLYLAIVKKKENDKEYACEVFDKRGHARDWVFASVAQIH